MTDSPSDQWLTGVREQAADRLARIAQLQDDLATLSAEAHTAEGRVRVRVNAAGRPIALTLAPTATSLPAAVLAAAVLRAVDQAAVRASERLAGLIGPLVPSAELDAMLTGAATDADRIGVRDELDALHRSAG